MPEDFEFDIDALQTQWEQEFADQNTTEEDSVDTQEDTQEQDEQLDTEESTEEDQEDLSNDEDSDEEVDEDLEDDSTEEDEIEEDVTEEDETNPELDTLKTENTDLQKQLQELDKYSSIFDEIAKQNGVSKDELLQQYERSKLEKEAQAQNVPVEYLEKQRQMEQELTQLKEGQQREAFNNQVNEVVDKYNLSDSDVRDTMKFAYANGIDVLGSKVNFEALYKAANFDTLLEKQVKESRQQELANKQKRMKQSSVTHGGSSNDAGPSVDDEVAEFLKEVL
jgi:hypothetical protein